VEFESQIIGASLPALAEQRHEEGERDDQAKDSDENDDPLRLRQAGPAEGADLSL
jgi:hypothetical protein